MRGSSSAMACAMVRSKRALGPSASSRSSSSWYLSSAFLNFPAGSSLPLLCVMELSNYGIIVFICTRFSCSLHQQPIQQLPVIFLCTLELARRQQLATAAGAKGNIDSRFTVV